MSDEQNHCDHEPLGRIERKVDGLCRDVSEMKLDTSVRLALLEQSEQRRNWWTTTAVGAAIVAFVGALWSLITGGR